MPTLLDFRLLPSRGWWYRRTKKSVKHICFHALEGFGEPESCRKHLMPHAAYAYPTHLWKDGTPGLTYSRQSIHWYCHDMILKKSPNFQESKSSVNKRRFMSFVFTSVSDGLRFEPACKAVHLIICNAHKTLSRQRALGIHEFHIPNGVHVWCDATMFRY